jgi:hypothetical protein
MIKNNNNNFVFNPNQILNNYEDVLRQNTQNLLRSLKKNQNIIMNESLDLIRSNESSFQSQISFNNDRTAEKMFNCDVLLQH